MADKIIILGSGTCNTEIEKANTSLLINSENNFIIYDFGYRVFYRLKQLNIPYNKINQIIISHFHPDHFSDLIPFLHSKFSSKLADSSIVNIYSSEKIYLYMNLIKKFFSSNEKFDKLVKLYNIENKSEFEINDLIFKINVSNHLSNISLKFNLNNKLITITGDIDFYKDNLKFFEYSDLCFFNSANLTENEIIRFKEEYKIKKLVILHAYRNLDINRGDIIFGKDLMEIKI